MKKIFPIVMFVVLLLGMTVPAARAQFFLMEHPLVGQKAPDFELDDLKAQKQDFAKITAGKNSILFFWTTWCPHCREQLGDLNKKKEQLKAAGIVLTLVDLGEDPSLVKRYLESNKMDFSVLLDQDGMVSEDYKVFGIPTFIFIDKTGTVRGVDNALGEDYLNYFKEGKK